LGSKRLLESLRTWDAHATQVRNGQVQWSGWFRGKLQTED
jgi:hypothetical protein